MNSPGTGTVEPWEWSNNEPGPAPYSYDVPGSLEVQPYTATATFNGESAAGDFVPTLSIYSQSGALLGSVFPAGVVMSPGDSAVVTWLPPFGSAAQAASGALETTDGTTTVDPTTELLIGSGITLTNPSSGVAELTGAGASAVDTVVATMLVQNVNSTGDYAKISGQCLTPASSAQGFWTVPLEATWYLNPSVTSLINVYVQNYTSSNVTASLSPVVIQSTTTPANRVSYAGNPVTINAGMTKFLTWDTQTYGGSLFTIHANEEAIPTVADIYAVSASVEIS